LIVHLQNQVQWDHVFCLTTMASAEIFSWEGKVDILLIIFRLLTNWCRDEPALLSLYFGYSSQLFWFSVDCYFCVFRSIFRWVKVLV